MIRFVFFDVGETLLCPQPSFPELATQVIRARGHEVDVGRVQRAARAVGSEHFRRAAEQGRVFSADPEDSRDFWTTLYAAMLTELELDDRAAAETLYRAFSDPENYDLFPDAKPILEGLRDRGMRLGVISNFEGWLLDLLERVGIADLFEVLAISGPLGVEKPDRRIFEWALEQAGETPEGCLHIGDQPFFDAEPARQMGMQAVLIDRHGRWADLDVEYPRIATLAELPPILERIGVAP